MERQEDEELKKRRVPMEDKKAKQQLLCKICNRSFSNQQNYNKHKNNLHVKNNSEVKCTICEAAFSNEYYLKDHMRRKHSDTVYECEKCGSTYKYRSGLVRHAKKCEGTAGLPPLLLQE